MVLTDATGQWDVCGHAVIDREIPLTTLISLVLLL